MRGPPQPAHLEEVLSKLFLGDCRFCPNPRGLTTPRARGRGLTRPQCRRLTWATSSESWPYLY